MNNKVTTAIMFIFIVFPFIEITNLFGEFNYFALLGMISFGLLLQLDQFKIDSIIIFWLYYIAAVMVLRLLPGNETGPIYSLLILPIGAINVYCFAKNSTLDQIEKFLKIFILFAAITALVTISQLLFGKPIYSSQEYALAEYWNDRNYFNIFFSSFYIRFPGMGFFEALTGNGSFLVMAVPPAFLFRKKNKSFSLVFWLIILGIIFTTSRGALLALILILTFLYGQERRKKIILYFLLFVIASTVFYELYDKIINYINKTENYSARLSRWEVVIPYAFSNFNSMILGFGPFYFKDIVFPKLFLSSNIHNMYIQIFLELGIVGTVLFIISIHNIYRKFTLKQHSLLKILIYSIGAFGVTQIFDHAFFGYHGIILMFFIGFLFNNRLQRI